MDPPDLRNGEGRYRLPRVSGDGPGATSNDAVQKWVAPRERGWTRGMLVNKGNGLGCPA